MSQWFSRIKQKMPPVSPEDVTNKKYVDGGKAFDGTVTKTGTVWSFYFPSLPTALPKFVNLRAPAEDDFTRDDTITINGQDVQLYTTKMKSVPGAAWRAGAVVELLWDTERNLAFFKGGAGDDEAWRIFPGMTPTEDSKPGLYIPDAVEPTLTLIAEGFEIAGAKCKQIASGAYHTIFLMEDGTVWSCGDNKYGQLGRVVNSGTISSANIGQITELIGVVWVGCGTQHSLFVLEDGTVWSCGYNQTGQLGRKTGNGAPSTSNLRQITGLSGVQQALGGDGHSVFFLKNGTVWNCGENTYGQLGRSVNSGTVSSVNLGHLTTLVGVEYISCGSAHTLFILGGGFAWSCGRNYGGQLGRVVSDGSASSINLGQITTLVNVKQVVAAGYYSYFLLESGVVWNCGQNYSGQLGRPANAGGSAKSSNLEELTVLSGVEEIFCGATITAFLLKDGSVWNCGGNTAGSLGRKEEDGATKVNIGHLAALSRVKSVNCGVSSHFILEDGAVWNCGDNSKGSLGRVTASGSPTVVNLAKIPDDALCGIPESLYPEGTLLIRSGSSAVEFPLIYLDDALVIKIPLVGIHQTVGKKEIPLSFLTVSLN